MVQKDRALCKSTEGSVDVLQLCTLKLLSPSTEGKTRKREVELPASPTRDKRRVENQVKIEAPPLPFSSSNDAGSSTVKKRVNRPTFIRRPKLIGKSVEGAAVHAVAASRARASNKQPFRGSAAMGSGQSQKAQPKDRQSDSNRVASSTKTGAAKSTGSETTSVQQTNEKRDEAFQAAKKRFEMFRETSSAPLILSHVRHADAIQRLASLWWPSQPKEAIPSIPRSVGEFYLSQSPRAWTDVCRLLTIPTRLVEKFAVSLAQTLAIWNPGVSMLQLSHQNSSAGDAAFLMGEMRRVRSCKCIAVFKLSVGTIGRQKQVVRSQGWVLTLPRHSRENDRNRDERQNERSLFQSEKDAAALDKLTTDLHVSIVCFGRKLCW